MNDLCLDDYNEPLTLEVFRDPYNSSIQAITYMYTIEPPFYYDLNKASLELNGTKLKSLGPFARVLSGILKSSQYSE